MMRLTAPDRDLIAQCFDLPAAPVAPAAAQALCCDGFRRGVIAASLYDPTCCMRCWPARAAERYGWRAASCGRIRRVPPGEAVRWDSRG